MKRIDLTNQKQHMLTAIKCTEIVNGCARWLCKCDCGKETSVNTRNWGNIKSCGCLLSIKAREVHLKHDMKGTRLYNIHNGIKARCLNKNAANYSNYGGRGVTVCDEWIKFELFQEWALTNGYHDNLSIDRIDVNGNYEPSNCRWADGSTQQNNTRTNHLITYNNETHTLAEWGKITSLKTDTIYKRISKYNWSVEKALTTPIK